MHSLSIFILLITLACASRTEPTPVSVPAPEKDSTVVREEIDYDTTQWTELTTDLGFVLDIKYATADNFIKEAVYPCGRCFLRKSAANALVKVQSVLKEKGYKLKLFDCYRPRPVQQKLWDKVPNPDYVARPSEGSMHNRGTAVDLTITDKSGKEINMGTTYDFFGPQAHHDYAKHDKSILDNRILLKNVMEKNGFASIRTEWWHYSLSSGSYKLEDWQWSCN